ncbi:MAG: hypothetical protein KIT39_19550 [Nitrospirales bacterium]|nr:hypothetical protein [Nitrospirales bacterium]
MALVGCLWQKATTRRRGRFLLPSGQRLLVRLEPSYANEPGRLRTDSEA